ncbi:Phosphoglycerate mutase 2, co-factor independent [Spiroplasma clarkii]|uniref:Phosphoglycerate mutase n=1 Tax=Spiroplasma clarkii TaxID=2139 RepID=A0A1Y0L2F1_9MOLU|nr:histidine phosphatase family protein [Spiroplasma clarkii]ARU91940.1 Phosphoglycerate mutase 2, co-factor independent [Spiroplasma clarkii]ATX71282.1 hypothetical protein SCLAR_v1c09800 [Spiroplasma clarkii]
MKKTIYFMRHGQTVFNELKQIQGWCDSPLTKFGIAQAKVAGQWFKDNQLVFQKAYCSTAERTADTIENVFPNLVYHRLKGLKEQGYGKFEGQPEFLSPLPPYNDFFKYAGGESETEVYARIAETIKSIAKADADSQILIVGHGAAIQYFLRKHLKENQTAPKFTNCSILIFEYENDDFEFIKVINHDYSHLKE